MRIELFIPKAIDRDKLCHQYVEMLRAGLTEQYKANVDMPHPDVIHVFGAWNMSAAMKIKQASKLLIPVVYSPLGMLAPWVKSENGMAKSAQMATFQRDMLRHATSVVSWGKQEIDAIRNMEKSVSIHQIANAIVSNATTPSQMVTDMMQVYEQAMAHHDKKIRLEIEARLDKLQVNDANIRSVAFELCYMRYLFHRGNIPKAKMQSYAQLLIATNFDEEKMEALLNDMHLYKFMESLEAVMEIHTSLTEGFMPIPAELNKLSKQIEKTMTDYPLQSDSAI